MHARRLWLLGPLATVLATTLPRSAQAWEWNSWGSGPKIEGSGKVIELRRSLGSFSRLRIEGPFNVVAGVGSAGAATIKADDNIVPLIQTEISGDTLIIKAKSNQSYSSRSGLLVTVDFQTLKAAEVRGSGNLQINSLKADAFALSVSGSGDARMLDTDVKQLEVSIAGSGDITVEGRADSAAYNIAGSGDVRAEKLLAKRSSVSIAGSGDAVVHASESLDVSIAGSGDVRYAGNPPQVKRSVVGSGEVKPLR
ncbi:head GIN domain-containing protein [Ideonella sp.]|uniref:head GIN domain-containing protein n=1 Tax=Ideonella sp. TaxID=1929293 RepID=UPI003BB80DEE